MSEDAEDLRDRLGDGGPKSARSWTTRFRKLIAGVVLGRTVDNELSETMDPIRDRLLPVSDKSEVEYGLDLAVAYPDIEVAESLT